MRGRSAVNRGTGATQPPTRLATSASSFTTRIIGQPRTKRGPVYRNPSRAPARVSSVRAPSTFDLSPPRERTPFDATPQSSTTSLPTESEPLCGRTRLSCVWCERQDGQQDEHERGVEPAEQGVTPQMVEALLLEAEQQQQGRSFSQSDAWCRTGRAGGVPTTRARAEGRAGRQGASVWREPRAEPQVRRRRHFHGRTVSTALLHPLPSLLHQPSPPRSPLEPLIAFIRRGSTAR